MEDNFNLIAQSRYYLKRFILLINDFKKVNEKEQDYALREMAVLIQECIELCIKGLVELLVGVDYKHTYLLVDNTLLLRNHKDNVAGFATLEVILDKVDSKASRICDFHTKAVYINSFATSEKELNECMEIAKELHLWIDNNISIKDSENKVN